MPSTAMQFQARAHRLRQEHASQDVSGVAKARFERCEGRPLLFADWRCALFVHYEIDPRLLQPIVPFALDCFEGRAYISLVAFTMERLRFNWPLRIGAAAGRLAALPCANHHLLNVRTYVTHDGEPGIYFIREWIPNALAALLGPRTFGLPYRLATMKYRHGDAAALEGSVEPRQGQGVIAYEARCDDGAALKPCEPESLNAFLLERYTAFTHIGRARQFRVWHEPWKVAPAEFQSLDDSAFRALGPWARRARLAGAAYTPGVVDVWMSRPRSVADAGVHLPQQRGGR